MDVVGKSRAVTNGILTVLALTVLIYGLNRAHHYGKKDGVDTITVQSQMVEATVSTAGVIMWPVVFDWLIGYQELATSPQACLGFLLPLLVTGSTGTFALRRQDKTTDAELDRQLTGDASVLASVAFAVSNLSMHLNLKRGTNSILVALMVLLTFVVPNPALPPRSIWRTAIQSGQQVALTYALGIIVSGIGMDVAQMANAET